MYAEFLETLSQIAKLLNEAARLGGSGPEGLPRPYLYGKVAVHLDGQPVGDFEFVDEWVQYTSRGVPAG